jgi:T5SS/PEP-CTERM-associated repeat protein
LDVAQFGISGGLFQSTYTVSFNNNATNQALHVEDDLVTFNLNSRTYTVTTATGIVIGNQAGGFPGRLTVNNGTVNSSTNIDVGAAASTTGTLIVGANGLISGAPSINIGKLGTGFLTVQSDGDISSTGSTTIGVGNGITGTATIIGNGTAGSATLLTGTLDVGSTGNGTVNVQLGGLLQNSGSARLGTGSLFTGVGTGIVNVMNAGSVWNSLGLLEVGDGGSGEVNITLGGTVNAADSIIGANVNGGGQVNVNGSNSLWDNSGTVTVGGLGPGTLNITNQGIVENSDGFIGTSSLTNSTGTVNVSGVGSRWTNTDDLTVGDASTGTLNITAGGTVQNDNGVVGSELGSTGTVTVGGAGSLWENSQSLSVGLFGEGTLNITGGGTVQNISGTVGALPNAIGHVTVDSIGSLWDSSSNLIVGHEGHGTLEINGGGIVQDSQGVVGSSSSGTGIVTVSGAGSLWEHSSNLLVGSDGDGTLEITDGARVRSRTAHVGFSSAGNATVSGAGSVWDNSGSSFTVGFTGAAVGQLDIIDGGIVQNNNGNVGTGASTDGHVTVSGDGSQWLNSGRLTVGVSGAGTLHITNGGKVVTDGHASIGQIFEEGTGDVTVSSSVPGTDSVWQIGGRLAVGVDLFAIGVAQGGAGTLRIQPGGTVTVGEDTIVTGIPGDLISLEGGTFTTSEIIAFVTGDSADANFEWTSGTLHVGVFHGDLENSAGVLAPGNSIGDTQIQGNYNQLTNGTLEIEIGPLGQGPQNDSVSVTGTATIDGQLNLSLIDGADPLPSQTFIILDANTLIGSFDNIASGQRLTTSDGLGSFLVNYGAGSAFDPTQIVLSSFLATALPGDYNQNGTVDAADYTVWRNNLGSGTALPNDDTVSVGQDDYARWKNHFGESTGSGAGSGASAAVPEPATLVLLAAAIVAIAFRRCN